MFSGVGGIVVYVLRFIDSTADIGDGLMWGLKVIPSFCLTNSIMFAAGKDQLLRLRTDIPSESFDV